MQSYTVNAYGHVRCLYVIFSRDSTVIYGRYVRSFMVCCAYGRILCMLTVVYGVCVQSYTVYAYGHIRCMRTVIDVVCVRSYMVNSYGHIWCMRTVIDVVCVRSYMMNAYGHIW